MAILTLRVPTVNDEVGRPTGCGYCGATTLQGWGSVPKPIRDTNGDRIIQIHRYRCTECGKTFRHYPAGVSAAAQTQRLKVTAAMMWAFGLSLRKATVFLAAFGAPLCHQTVWEDGVELGKQLAQRRPKRVRVLGVDGTGARIGGKSSGVVVAIDMGTGRPVDFVELDERDPEAVRKWLAPLVEQLGVEVLVTDDLAGYGPVAEALQVDRQVCLWHVKRSTGKTLSELGPLLGPEWQPTIEDIGHLMDNLPPDGGYQLSRAWEALEAPSPKPGQTATPLYRLRLLLQHLSRIWQDLLLHQRRLDVPATNNRTENAIGRYKNRARSMRGVKSAAGRQAMFQLRHANLVS